MSGRRGAPGKDAWNRPDTNGGPIAWLVRNRVTPNLLMIVFIIGGLFMATRIKQEVFPDFSMDRVTVRVPYPGASPEEVERGILLVVEEAVRGLEGVDEVSSTASEGSGSVNIELLEGANQQRLYQDIQQAVDRIRTFPDDAEDPTVSLSVRRREVIDLQVYGDVPAWTLREVAEDVRDRLLQTDGITQVDVENAPDPEVRIEIDQETLRTYGLTLPGVARIIRDSAVEVPGGSIETEGGELLLRVNERRDWADEFADIPVVATAEGSLVRLGDIAVIGDGFEDVERDTSFDGNPALTLEIYRIGDETPIGVSDAVHGAIDTMEPELPEGVSLAITRDSSTIYRQRLELLLKNGFLGLLLVLLILGLFLEVRLAFWVTVGIPTAFLGGLMFMPLFGVTINMISMFAFIIALGIVVDDAIVAGENIYEYRQRGMSYMDAAIQGARDVALPVGFSILTNIVAFAPLMFVPGFMGKIWRVIPAVVATVFILSWVECLFILPGHLLHGENERK
ncbi:MAG: efflux RND transporter permease subunit, partial [Planctomycetota bacterium]